MVENLIAKLVRACLDNDIRTTRSLATRIVRQLRATHPDIANEIAQALDYHGIGISTRRAVGIDAAPFDDESKLSLAVVEEPVDCLSPILCERNLQTVTEFINERQNSTKLLANGLTPPSSILLVGPPGVGKTHLARYLSGVFNLRLVTLDLAASISSFLGKTGQNIKMIFEYARNEPSLLFLDEFDAIAKRRDDFSDLGELKRIVNVLLKEMEDWPPNSVLIAATNHPDLLDKAIWRRFDRVMNLELPGRNEREQILENQFHNYPGSESITPYSHLISELTEGYSGSELCKFTERVKRKIVLSGQEPLKLVFEELAAGSKIAGPEFNKLFCKAAKRTTKMSLTDLAELLGKSRSAIQYYLRGE